MRSSVVIAAQNDSKQQVRMSLGKNLTRMNLGR